MRFGMFAGLPGGLLLGDVRHAHSHLMFYSWATPALMLLIGEAARRAGARFRAGAWCAIAAAVAGLLAYLPFLLSGYRLLAVGDSALPLSMMASGLNGVAWYAFALLYLVATWRTRRTTALRFADGAVVALIVASVGAVLLAVAGMSGAAEPHRLDAFVDMFLTLFADGWFGLGVLAALLLTVFADLRAPARLAGLAWLLTAGLVIRTAARLAVDAYGVESLALVESAGGLLAGLTWLGIVVVLLAEARGATRLHAEVMPGGRGPTSANRLVALGVLLLLAFKAVVELVLAIPAGEAFVAREGLRVLFLHAFLLGAITLACATAMRSLLGSAAWRWLVPFTVLVGVMLACLVPLTGLWPARLSGPWTLKVAFYSSLGPAAAGLLALLTSRPSAAAANEPRRVNSAAPSPRGSRG